MSVARFLITLCGLLSNYLVHVPSRDSESVIFNSGQKMALRAFYWINVHRTYNISTQSDLSACSYQKQ